MIGLQRDPAAADVMSGTFARVWLVRLKGASGGDENKVFALKILRKVDGMGTLLGIIGDVQQLTAVSQ